MSRALRWIADINVSVSVLRYQISDRIVSSSLFDMGTYLLHGLSE
jgi:hypothetical protein